MYCKYVTNTTPFAGATIIDDIVKLITGSPLSALSASCDKVNSVLISDVAPGWTLHDAAAGSGSLVVKALDADGLTTKYVRVHTNNSLDVYESWNATTHAGTNPGYTAGVSAMAAMTSGAATTMHIFATPRSITLLYGTYMHHAGEMTREAQYLKGTVYPVHFLSDHNHMGSGASDAKLFVPRMKSMTAPGDITGSSSYANMGTFAWRASPAAKSNWQASTTTLRDQSDVVYHEIKPFFALTNSPYYNSLLGRLHDVSETTSSFGTIGDVVSDGTYNYFVVRFSYSTLALRMH